MGSGQARSPRKGHPQASSRRRPQAPLRIGQRALAACSVSRPIHYITFRDGKALLCVKSGSQAQRSDPAVMRRLRPESSAAILKRNRTGNSPMRLCLPLENARLFATSINGLYGYACIIYRLCFEYCFYDTWIQATCMKRPSWTENRDPPSESSKYMCLNH